MAAPGEIIDLSPSRDLKPDLIRAFRCRMKYHHTQSTSNKLSFTFVDALELIMKFKETLCLNTKSLEVKVFLKGWLFEDKWCKYLNGIMDLEIPVVPAIMEEYDAPFDESVLLQEIDYFKKLRVKRFIRGLEAEGDYWKVLEFFHRRKEQGLTRPATLKELLDVKLDFVFEPVLVREHILIREHDFNRYELTSLGWYGVSLMFDEAVDHVSTKDPIREAADSIKAAYKAKSVTNVENVSSPQRKRRRKNSDDQPNNSSLTFAGRPSVSLWLSSMSNMHGSIETGTAREDDDPIDFFAKKIAKENYWYNWAVTKEKERRTIKILGFTLSVYQIKEALLRAEYIKPN